jgi:hypothetical protein
LVLAREWDRHPAVGRGRDTRVTGGDARVFGALGRFVGRFLVDFTHLFGRVLGGLAGRTGRQGGSANGGLAWATGGGIPRDDAAAGVHAVEPHLVGGQERIGLNEDGLAGLLFEFGDGVSLLVGEVLLDGGGCRDVDLRHVVIGDGAMEVAHH